MRGLATRFRSVNSAQPRQRDPAREAAGKPSSFIAPVLGLKLFDGLAAIPEGGAVVLDNCFPLKTTVRARAGCILRNTGITGTVRAIGTYTSGVSRKAFAVSGEATDAIYDVSSPGDVGAALVSGLVPADWSFAQFTTSGGQFLIACGYGNTRRVYDGSSWATTPAITGVDPADLSAVWIHANRPFFVEGGTMRAWYLPVDSVGGAATKIELGGEFPRGGALLAGATWTMDAGSSGLRSQCVFISTEGDIAVYEGINPASATDWTKTGTYQIAKPCGINCFLKTGGDLAVLTEDGLIAMSQVISLDRAALANESVSKDIWPLWRDRVARTDTSKWSICRRDYAGMAIVAVPKNASEPAYQFVVNLQSGAWARWHGWDATCFATVGDELIFGTANGGVYTGEAGGSDDGAPYTWSYIGRYDIKGARVTAARLARAVLRANEDFPPKVGVLFDYSETLPLPPPAGVLATGALWDGVNWDGFLWGRAEGTRAVWQSCSGHGSAFAPCFQMTFGQDETPQVELIRMDLITEFGAVVA